MCQMAMSNICVVAASLLVLVATISADGITISDLVKHIQRLDSKIAQLEGKHRDEIEDLRQQMRLRERECDMKMVELFTRVANIEERNDGLSEENNEFPTNSSGHSTEESTNDKGSVMIDNESSMMMMKNNKEKEASVNFKHMANEVETWRDQSAKSNPRRALNDSPNVAFSAYLDHDADSLGVGQTLIFNKVLLNDGGAYNTHSGMFTAPVDGVYSFSFFIGENDDDGVHAALWVNSENKVDAAVDAFHTSQDLQGGNIVNLKLATGDIVYVRDADGNHVEGSTGLRLTTFSGFLIYPAASPAVVGK